MLKIQRQQQNPSTDDSGFTIIESLISMVVVAILLASTAPVLVMSTAIRVQAKRIEKSAQVANTFIDGVRTGSVPAPGKIIPLKPATSTAARNQADNLITLTTMPVPTASSTSNTNKDLYLAKKDGNICLVATGCTRDPNNPFDEFYIQAAQIRVEDSASTTGYRLGMRVYRADIDLSKTVLASANDGTNNVKAVDSPITSGLGNKQAPIIERAVDIAGSATTFQSLCSRLGIAQKAGVNQNCPQ